MGEMNRREFFAGLGGIFAAAVLVKPKRATFAYKEPLVYYGKFIEELRPPNVFEQVRLVSVSIVSTPTNMEFRLEGATSHDGPWSPIEMFPPPRFVRGAFINREPVSISYGFQPALEAGGQDEEEEGVVERSAEEEGVVEEAASSSRHSSSLGSAD